jgi:tetratricopeptide (TPR) repeat protein
VNEAVNKANSTPDAPASGSAAGVRVTIPDVRLSPAEASLLAGERYAAKRLGEAEKLCRTWLSVQPEASGALHLLGIICLDSGRRHEAQELLQLASAIAPNNANIRRNLGSALSLLARPEDAIVQFEAALAIDPADAGASRNLGLSLRSLGRMDEAAAAFERALAQRPNFAKAARNLGVALLELGEAEKAEAHLRHAVELAPNVAANRAALGAALRARGKADEAIGEYRAATDQAPDNAEFWFAFGNLLRSAERHLEAANAYTRVLALRANWPAALSNLAGTRLSLGAAAEAEELARRAVELEPQNGGLLVNLGAILQSQKRYGEAIDCYRQALAKDPNAIQAQINLGTALLASGEGEAAVAAAERARELAPDSAEAQALLGQVLSAEGRFAEAEEACRRRVALTPDNAEALIAHGDALRSADRLDEAIDTYRRALTVAPDSAHAHANLGMAFLGAGRYAEGWSEYEWRWKAENFPTRPRHEAPRWDGSDPAGKTVLLHAEQGHGDSIQFLRYAPLVAARGARVILECHAPVLPLAAKIPGIAAAMPLGGEVPAHDLQAPLMSLPHIMGSTLANLPRPDCFSVPAELADKWRQRWRRLPGPRIGLAWQGSKLHPGDRFRSIPLSRFAGLVLVPGYSFVSLQIGPGREQIAESGYGGRLLDPKAEDYGGEAYADFLETAAMLQALDLVITIDTALAHLAGSLGRPAWVLLPRPADWRWLTERSTSPWYSSLRLFRQPAPGDWASVLLEVERALRAGEGP